MLSTILVPLDGSSLAEQARPFAERLARVAQARVILARVVAPFSAAETTIEASIARTAHENLEEIASKLRRAETRVEVAVLSGDASAEILRACAARDET
jgi:nucleotide-binding universal stress UspA family protein